MVRCFNCMKEYDDQFEICPHCGFLRGQAPKEAYCLLPGVMLGNRFEVGTVLGLGGFGITYRAWDTKLDRVVAVKEYYPSGMVNRIPGEKEVIIYSGNKEREFQAGKSRFLDEAQNMAKFNQQPNIVNVIDYFQENNTAYIIMEFLDGVSFKEYISQHGGKVDIDMGVSVVIEVANALKIIHKHKIIHRDVSPDNIFMCSDGRIKLIDFGAARFSAGESEKTMSVILKPGYAPPEQYRNKSRQGPWTDIYALGAVLYRALTGKMPDESVNRVEKDELIEPKVLNAEIPDYLNDSIMRAMALDQNLRFQSMDQFIGAILQEKKVIPLNMEISRRKRFRWMRIGVIGLVLCIGSGACFMLYQNKRKQAYGLKADLELWIEGDKEGRKELYETAAEEFNQYYKDIHITLKETEEREKKAAVFGSLEKPDIFSSSGFTEEELKEAAVPLENFGKDLKEDTYYFQDQIEEYGKSRNQMPTGFEMPVVYVNIGMMGEGTEQSKSQWAKEQILEGQFCMDSEDKALYQDFLWEMGNADKTAQEKESFYDKETAVLLGTTSDYGQVQEKLTGLYEVVWPSEIGSGQVYARFSEQLSISSELTHEEREAAEAFMSYLLSEPGQDILNVRGSLALPLNKDMYQEYIGINKELTGAENELNHIQMLQE